MSSEGNTPPDFGPLAEMTRILEASKSGDHPATNELLELVYDELRRLAQSLIAGEPRAGAGMTLQATALVHEAYVRLVTPPADNPDKKPTDWKGRGHFFGAVALTMRRILVERARNRSRTKHGGGVQRVGLEADAIASPRSDHDGTDVIAIDEALQKLEKMDARKGKIVTLRFFAGLTVEETAAALDLSNATVKKEWASAKAWLLREMSGSAGPG